MNGPLRRGRVEAAALVPPGGRQKGEEGECDRCKKPAPIDDKLFFAGEATASSEWATQLSGAWQSGVDAANALTRSLSTESDVVEWSTQAAQA